jgi:hypothetical protein
MNRAAPQGNGGTSWSAGVGTFVVLALVAFWACSPPGSDRGAPEVSVSCRIEPHPPQTGPVRAELVLADLDGAAIAGARIALEANMHHAGMVPVFVEASELADGRYEAAFEFTMGGDWFLLVDAALADGRTLQRRIDVPGVRPR